MESISLFDDKTLEISGALFAIAGAADLSQRVCGSYVDTKIDCSCDAE